MVVSLDAICKAGNLIARADDCPLMDHSTSQVGTWSEDEYQQYILNVASTWSQQELP
jgi:hypothetical protein